MSEAMLHGLSCSLQVTEAESSAFLRRIQSGDPTPVQFLCSATTVVSGAQPMKKLYTCISVCNPMNVLD